MTTYFTLKEMFWSRLVRFSTKWSELAAECTAEEKYEDWWWKERLGKCYYQLGDYRESEKQFKSSLKLQETTNAY